MFIFHNWFKIGNWSLCLSLWTFYSVRESGEKKHCWKPAKGQGFEVGGYYHSLSMSHAMSFPWKISWRLKVPPRVAFFSWIAALGKILSTNNLQKRDIIVLDW